MGLRAITSGLILLLACGDDQAAGGSGGSGGAGEGGEPACGECGGNHATGGGGAETTGGSAQGGSGGMTCEGSGGLPGGPSSTRTTVRPVGSVEGAPLGFVEYLPPGYGDGCPRPLVLFHHGIGESGNGSAEELDRIDNTGLPALMPSDQWPEERPFIVLSSQHDAPPFTSCHSVEEIEAFMTFALDHYDVDLSRVYITGLSCGAIGSWNYLGAHTNETVAAAVLIAGDGHGAFNQAGCQLGTVPIWAFHGSVDGTVNPAGSTEPIEALQACTDPVAVDARVTIYEGVDHNSWDRTYDLSAGNDIYAWLLGHVH